LLIMPSLAGCCAYDVLFGVFGDYYSGGGTTREEKRLDYENQIERFQQYDPAGSP